MRRAAILALACVAVWALGAPAGAQASEAIRSYDVAIEIRADDSIRITEVIEYDFGQNQRHGILRDIPTRQTYDERYDRVYPLHVESVTATGASADYDVSSQPGGITQIKIGDPDVTTSGVHTYTIVYTVDAAMNGFDDHDELYWNAVGEEWDVPVDRATATVTAPAEFLDAACFAGPVGAYTACDRQRVNGEIARFRHDGLPPFQAFTVVVALPKGAVAEPQPRLVEPWSLGRAFSRTPVTLGCRAVCSSSSSRAAAGCCGAADAIAGSSARRSIRRWGTRPAMRRRCRCSNMVSRRWSSRRRRICDRARSARSSTSRRTRSTSPRRSWIWPFGAI